MGARIDTKLSGLRGRIFHQLKQRSLRRERANDIFKAVEMAVDGTDPKIRLVGGYRNKLFDAVESSLAFVAGLVRQIPSPIEISADRFVSDPYVNAFFTDVDELRSVLACSSELHDFLEEHGTHGQLPCCCLLCMQKTEKPVLGMELSGDILRKEVRQTAVCFSDHRIYSPATTEAAARQGLGECLFGGLLTNALEHIMQCRVENLRLQCDRRMLHARLRHLEYQLTNGQEAASHRAGLNREIAEIQRKLRANEAELMAVHTPTPRESLAIVKQLLEQPDKYIRLNRSTLRLDRMGIRIDGHPEQRCNELDLTEVAIGGEPTRVVTLARFPPGELSPQADAATRRLFP